jgi:hypothetical protein
MSERFFPLTDREREVLSHLAEGEHPVSVAQRLWISTNTLRNHMRNVDEKVNAELDMHDGDDSSDGGGGLREPRRPTPPTDSGAVARDTA